MNQFRSTRWWHRKYIYIYVYWYLYTHTYALSSLSASACINMTERRRAERCSAYASIYIYVAFVHETYAYTIQCGINMPYSLCRIHLKAKREEWRNAKDTLMEVRDGIIYKFDAYISGAALAISCHFILNSLWNIISLLFLAHTHTYTAYLCFACIHTSSSSVFCERANFMPFVGATALFPFASNHYLCVYSPSSQ